MQSERLAHFLTLVLAIAGMIAGVITPHDGWGAPAPPQPQLDEPATMDDRSDTTPDPLARDTIDITPAPLPKTRANQPLEAAVSSEYFYRYRTSLSPRFAAMYSSDPDSESSLYALGFQYLMQTRTFINYEAGVDLISNGTGRIHGARRWIFSRNRFRPYARAGAGVKIIPKEGLTTVLRVENFQARGGVGFEQLIRGRISFRSDLDLAVGTKDAEALFAAGCSWAW